MCAVMVAQLLPCGLVSAFRQRSITTRMDGQERRLYATLMKSPEMRARNKRLMAAGAAVHDHLESHKPVETYQAVCWKY